MAKTENAAGVGGWGGARLSRGARGTHTHITTTTLACVVICEGCLVYKPCLSSSRTQSPARADHTIRIRAPRRLTRPAEEHVVVEDHAAARHPRCALRGRGVVSAAAEEDVSELLRRERRRESARSTAGRWLSRADEARPCSPAPARGVPLPRATLAAPAASARRLTWSVITRKPRRTVPFPHAGCSAILIQSCVRQSPLFTM